MAPMTTATDLPEASPPHAAPAAWSPPLDADGRLASEIACRGCGYVLRGLRPDDRCPECGEPVAESLRPDLLLFADPAWRDRLLRGCRWLLAWIVAAIAVTLATPLWWGVVSAFIGTTNIDLLLMVATLLPVVPLALAANAVRLLTSRDPAYHGPAAPAANVARICVFAMIGLILVVFLLRVGSTSSLSGSGWMLGSVAGPVASVGNQALSVAWKTALLLVLAALARRLPNRLLTRQLRGVGWAIAVAGGLGVATTIGQLVYINLTPSFGATPAQTTPPSLPPVQFPQPSPGSPAQTQQLQDGTYVTVYQETDPANPMPSGLSVVEEFPDGTERTSTRSATPTGDTLVTEFVVDPSGATFTTTTTYNAGGNIISQNTSISSATSYTGRPWLVFAILNAGFGLLYFAALIWGIVLMVWFYRKLRDVRGAAAAAQSRGFPAMAGGSL